MNLNPLQQSLLNWFMRKTTSSAVRRVADLPMAIATDIGLVRTENQDRAVVLRVQLREDIPTVIAVLCDGMGGMTDGSICSSLAISAFLSGYVQNINLPIKDRIVTSVLQANDIVFEKYNGSGGSTLSAFVIDHQEGIFGVNVGDSRIYSMDGHKLLQMTVDDTLAGQFANDNGDAYGRNELLQYIGMGQGIEPHIVSLSGSSILPSIVLTSDGVHFLDKRTMELVAKHASDSALAARRLIELSKWCGGHDNASAIIANLSKIKLERTNLNLGELEIWDAFGELQLINTQNSYLSIHTNKTILKTETAIPPKINEQRRGNSRRRVNIQLQDAPELKEKAISKAKKIKTLQIKKDEKKQDEVKITPQLQIDFDNK